MITLGIVVAVCMGLLDYWVWRYMRQALLQPGEGKGRGGGLGPQDLPGDGLSPWDLFLRELPTTPMDDGLDRAVTSG